MKRLRIFVVLLTVVTGCSSSDQLSQSADHPAGASTRSSGDIYRRIGELEAERARQQNVIRLSEQFIRDNNAENEDSLNRGIYILMDNSHNYQAEANARSRIAEIDVELARLRRIRN